MSEPIPENAFYFVVDGRAYVAVQLSLDTE
jgi:hypothetical protein